MPSVPNVRANHNYPTSAARNHPRYHFQDGSVVLRAQDTIYKVHWDVLKRHSEYFYSSLIQPALRRNEGLKDYSPIILRDVEPAQLDSFLSLFYPSTFLKHDISTTEEWISVLALSTKWRFTSLRELAITSLDSITTPAERVVIGRSFDVGDWVVPAYRELCTSGAPLSREDARMLGLEDVLSIWEVQHRLAKEPLDEDATRLLIEELFPPNVIPYPSSPPHAEATLAPGDPREVEEDTFIYPTEETHVHVEAHMDVSSFRSGVDEPSGLAVEDSFLTPVNGNGDAVVPPAVQAALEPLLKPNGRLGGFSDADTEPPLPATPPPPPRPAAPALAPAKQIVTPTQTSAKFSPVMTPPVTSPRPKTPPLPSLFSGSEASTSPKISTTPLAAGGGKKKKKKGGAAAK